MLNTTPGTMSNRFPALCALASVLCAAYAWSHWLPLLVAGLAVFALVLAMYLTGRREQSTTAWGEMSDLEVRRADK